MSTDAPWSSLDRNSGRQDFLKHVRHLVKEDPSFLYSKSESSSGVTKCIYQLVQQTIRRQLKLDAALTLLGDLAFLHHDLPSLILDVFGILDAETALASEADERNMFCSLVKETESFLSENLLKERMEIDTLQDVGTVKNRTFYTRFIKVKTKLYYKQRRFNLFREESEGYAKLITELNQEDSLTDLNALEMIKSLIGCFNLDPNRVLDVIIESFEMHPNRSALFVPLLQNYVNDGSTICEVLGYKFRHFCDSRTPSSLFKITAILLQAGVFHVDDIYSWLGPEDGPIGADWKAEIAEAREFVRRLNVVALNKEKEEEEEKTGPEEKYVLNQKWQLCEALLGVGDWENALVIIRKQPEHSVLVHEPVAKALCSLLNTLIDPLYREKCPFRPPRGESSRVLPKLPLVTAFGDLETHAIPMFVTLGPSLHHDPVLLHKLVNLLKTAMEEGADIDEQVLTLLDSSVLPALGYLDCNCCVAEEVWDVLRHFPYHLRYSLYGRWKNETYLVHPRLIRRRGMAQKQIKAIMKRVSKENVKPVGRQIGKLSHCSPGFLFDYILLQIQIYDNLIGPVVESLRYLTSLSYDVLGYCIIETLAQADRARLETDGTSLSLWLQSLANFCGAIFKKYNIELNGLLQYVANQLKGQKSLDLLILKEIVQKMTGIEAAEEMTADQVRAMCGGEILRGEAGYFAQVRNTKKSSQRLKDALATNDLAVALALLIAQQKHCVIYHETTHSHLKLVGSNYSVEEYIERLPSIHAMLQEYHIHADVAFFLARPMFSHAISQKYDQLRKADPNSKKLTTALKLAKYLDATQAVMDPIALSVRPLHPAKIWEDISPQFLCTFWSLSMYDLEVPTDAYTKEILKLKQQSLAIMDNKDANASKNKKDQERFLALMEKLQDERKKQQEHVDKTLHRLGQEKDSWFLSRSLKAAKNETITQFLQLCLFPRCTFTALDALYCAKFVQVVHSLKTTNFSTLLCYDRIFCDITLSVTSCTENEATRYGRFLCAMLETVMKWHMDEATFNKECSNYPGFVTKFRVSNQFSEANDHVGYENFRHVCHKWHYKITKSLVFCLDSKDYMQTRNALIILMRILPHFPVLTKLAQIIERKIEKVRDEEKNKRQDLFVLASSYIGQLKARASQMMRESDFHQVVPEKAPVAAPTKAAPVASDEKKTELIKSIDITKSPKPAPTKATQEKKLTRTLIKPPSPAPTQVIEIIDKDRQSPSPVSVREASVASTKSSRGEQKKREKEREKAEQEDRKKESRRRAKRGSPDSYYKNEEVTVVERQERMERDLSSVSNSSAGSPPRMMEPPETVERDSKRRKIEAPKKSSSEGKREKSSKAAKKEKSDEGKEQRREKRKKSDRDEISVSEKRLRREDEKTGQYKNGGSEEPSPRVSSKHHHRDVSPYEREEHEVSRDKYKSRTRSGY